MDYQLLVVSDDGDLSWSDSRSMDSMDSMGSDDGQSMMLPDSPPEWMDQLPPSALSMSGPGPINIPHTHTGQLSPVSNGMDVHGHAVDNGNYATGASDPSHASMMAHSASSSSTDSWNMDYVDSDDMTAIGNAGVDAEYQWEQGSDDVLTVPKLEPLDEDEVRLDDVKEAPSTLVPVDEVTGAPIKVKRPRGRPRKHPLTPLVASNKVTKGRSKTGCLTCRKRKKKCDEAKPRCMNCEKNSVFCEGYPEKQIWKSGKERAEEERLKSHSLPVITMQPIFHGLETAEDRIFWKHYNEHLSSVLTVEGEHKNAFKDMIIPVAVKHHGLMHSILSLSSKHIDYDTPYGLNILRNNPSTSLESLQQRSDFHHNSAFEKLRLNFARQVEKSSPEYKDILFGRYGQMLCFILESMVEGNPRGEHRFHLKAYQSLIQESPPEDPAFLAFITEFFQYHIFADELVRFDDDRTTRLASEDWTPPIPIHPPRLLGVADGIFNLMSQITTIRNTIRRNMEHHIDPVVDYTSLYQADGIYAAIQDWAPHFPPGDSRGLVGLLYKQMMWIYLFRTVYPPSPSLASSSSSLPLHSAPSSGGLPPAVVNTPPLSATSSCASSPTLPAGASEMIGASFNLPGPGSSQPSRKNSQRHSTRANSPEPIRQPLDHDPRITVAVEESLSILDSFKPSDPSQTLLLIPCMIIGSACFSPSQQERVRTAIRTVRGYTGLRHTYRVAEVLEEVWRLMEVGDWAAVWDWQKVARGLNIDFLI